MIVCLTKRVGVGGMGQVWPGACHFPDFMYEEGQAYWRDLVEDFHHTIPFDGLWVRISPAPSLLSILNNKMEMTRRRRTGGGEWRGRWRRRRRGDGREGGDEKDEEEEEKGDDAERKGS